MKVLACALAMALVIRVPAATPNFSGLWRPDTVASTKDKVLKDAVDSRFGPAPPPPPPGQSIHPTERIEHVGSAITIVTVDESGRDISSLELTTDRQEATNPVAGGLLTHKSRSWWDGNALHVNWTVKRGGEKIVSGTDTRSMLDATRMRLVRDLEDGKSRTHAVIVLRKASPR